MKKCPNCGSEALDEAEWCMECAKPLTAEAVAAFQSENPQLALSSHRPDGSQAMLWGGFGIILGVVLIFFAMRADEVGTSWNLIIFGGGLAQLGLLIWLAGYIVKAISFIPGRDV